MGRIFVFNLYPLSFEEFLRYRNESLSGIYFEKKEAIKKYLFEKYMPDKTIVACRDILEDRDGTTYLPFVFIASLI